MINAAAQFSVGLGGKFRAIVTKADGRVVHDKTFHNVVLDSGFDRLFSNAVFYGSASYVWNVEYLAKYLWLGTGTTQPQKTDLGLESRSATLSGKAISSIIASGGSYDATEEVRTAYVTLRYDYLEGEAEGVWTELGASADSAYNIPYNRSLFKDQNGNPISLTILSDEYLTVELTLYYQDGLRAPITGSTTVNGVAKGYSVSGLGYVYTRTGYSAYEHVAKAFWARLPFVYMRFRNQTSPDLYSSGSIGAESTYDETQKVLTVNLVLDPGSEVSVYGLSVYASGSKHASYALDFDTPVVKPANDRLTATATLQFTRGPDVLPPL